MQPTFASSARPGWALAVISPQSESRTAALARRFDVPMAFCSDPGARAARVLGIDAAGSLPAGLEVLGYANDTATPAAILIDDPARVVWRDETDNHRVRTRFCEWLASSAPTPNSEARDSLGGRKPEE